MQGTTASTRSAVGSHEEKAPHNGNGKDASGADILGARSADVDVEKVPITWKTYIVVFTCYLYQLQQIYFLLGSAFVVAYVPLALPVWWHTQVNSLPQASYVTKDIGSVALTNWIPIIPNLGQACLSPALVGFYRLIKIKTFKLYMWFRPMLQTSSAAENGLSLYLQWSPSSGPLLRARRNRLGPYVSAKPSSE